MPRHIKKLLKELKEGLVRIYADELKAVYLYGSYARDEANSDSDIDVLVVLKGDFNYIEMLKRSDDFTIALCLENDVLISRAFVSEAEYKSKQTPFLMNVRRDAVAV
ncbi:MAG: nucleotidyltransferase domain-containing protein [Anaerolineales bacterium]